MHSLAMYRTLIVSELADISGLKPVIAMLVSITNFSISTAIVTNNDISVKLQNYTT
jgi:hypothetical protein